MPIIRRRKSGNNCGKKVVRRTQSKDEKEGKNIEKETVEVENKEEK